MPVWRDIAENGAVRGLAVLSNVVVLFATARVLGPDDRGRLVSIVIWTMLLATIAGFSLGQVSHRQIQSDDQEGWMAELGGTLAGAGVVGALIVAMVTWLLFGSSAIAIAGSPAALVLAALTLPFLVLDEYARNLLAASGQIRHYSIAQLSGGGFRLVSVALVLVASPSVIAVLACLLASQILVAGLEFLMLNHTSKGGFRFARRRLETLLRDAVRLHPNTIASFLLVQANVLLLSRMTSSAEVAQYQLAQQLALAPILLPQAGAMVLFGSVARLGPDGASAGNSQTDRPDAGHHGNHSVGRRDCRARCRPCDRWDEFRTGGPPARLAAGCHARGLPLRNACAAMVRPGILFVVNRVDRSQCDRKHRTWRMADRSPRSGRCSVGDRRILLGADRDGSAVVRRLV